MKKLLFIAAAAALALVSCKKDPKAEIVLSVDETVEVSSVGQTIDFNLRANYAWTAEISGDVKLTVDPAQGTGDAAVKIVVEENESEKAIEGAVKFVAKGGGAEDTKTVTIKQEALKPGGFAEVEYAGVKYRVKKMKDGRFWFVDNLRYLPQGKKVSKELTDIDNGVWYPLDAVEKKITDNADTVAKKGYLYNVEAALGIAAKTLTATNFSEYEGARGICPEGWHIPTLDEIANLVGRVNISKYDLKKDPGPITTAPYWDVEAGKATLAKANADGFDIRGELGYLNANATATAATPIVIMSYILSSTGVPREDNTITQFYGIMPAKATASCNGGTHNYRGGAIVRCIKDKKK